MTALMFPALGAAATTAMASGGSAAASGFPAWLAPMLAGSGQFLGGLSNLSGGQEKQKYVGKYHKKALQNEMSYRLQYARQYGEKFGFHPLAALGINPASGGSGWVRSHSGMSGRAFANMGAGLSKMATGQSEIQKAQVAESLARARYYNSMANKVDRPVIDGQPNALVVDKAGVVQKGQGHVTQPTQVNPQIAPGYQAGPSGFYNFAMVPDRGVQTFPTQKFQESTSEGFHALEYGIKMAGKWGKGISLDNLNTVKGMMARNALRNEQRAVEKQFGGRYAYSPFSRTWYPTNTDRLFLPTKRNILSRYSRKYEYGSGKLAPSHRSRMFDLSDPIFFD